MSARLASVTSGWHRPWVGAVALAALLAVALSARADEACLAAPTPPCIVTEFAADADLPLHALRPISAAEMPLTRLLSALLMLGEIERAEQLARRAPRESGAERGSDWASPIAVARFLASARNGTPDFAWLDGLSAADGPLAPLYGRSAALGDARRASNAYPQAALRLLAEVAAQHRVVQLDRASSAVRSTLRDSPAWRGLDAGIEAWNRRLAPNALGWTILADLRITVNDDLKAREALDHIGDAPATGLEIRQWWRLGDMHRAEQRARASSEASAYFTFIDLAIERALAAGDHAGALRMIDEAWPAALARQRYGGPSVPRAMRLIQASVAAGGRRAALRRAQDLRGLVQSIIASENETHWIDAGAALTSIGEPEAAAALLSQELAWRPGLRAARCVPASADPPPVQRRGVLDLHALGVEFVRAGQEETARCVLDAIRLPFMPHPRGRQEDASRAWLRDLGMSDAGAAALMRQEHMIQRANWMLPPRPLMLNHWARAIRSDARHSGRIDAILAFLAPEDAETRAPVLLAAADTAMREGLTGRAIGQIAEALALLPALQRPFPEACRMMALARSLERDDLADAAFRVAVQAARGEPDFVRGAVLVDMAACRAGLGER